MSGFIWEAGCAFIYIYSIVFVYAIAALSIYSKYYPFYHWAAYHLWNVFSGAGPCALPFSTNAFSGPEPRWPSYHKQFFFI